MAEERGLPTADATKIVVSREGEETCASISGQPPFLPPVTLVAADTPGMPLEVPVDLPITLGQFIKVAGLASTGGEAKQIILGGQVCVNNFVEVRRGRKLATGDVVSMRNVAARVVLRTDKPGTPKPSVADTSAPAACLHKRSRRDSGRGSRAPVRPRSPRN